MPNKIKKLYFTSDFSPENVQKLEGDGWILRNANLAKSDSFIERANEYGGDVPEHYKSKGSKAAAECEKLQTENTDIISDLTAALDEKDTFKNKFNKALEDLESERAIHTAFMNDADAMQSRIDELKQSASSSSGGEVANDQVFSEEVSVTVEKPAENDYASWTVPQIKEFLASKEIGFKSSASKDELLALIPKE